MVRHSHAQALIVRLWGESSPEEITDLTVLHVTLTSAKAVFTGDEKQGCHNPTL